MPEAAAKPKLVVIAGRLHVGEPVRDEKKLLHAERYLAGAPIQRRLFKSAWLATGENPVHDRCSAEMKCRTPRL